MMRQTLLLALTLVLACAVTVPAEAAKKKKKVKNEIYEPWPDGTPMDSWFQQTAKVCAFPLSALRRKKERPVPISESGGVESAAIRFHQRLGAGLTCQAELRKAVYRVPGRGPIGKGLLRNGNRRQICLFL